MQGNTIKRASEVALALAGVATLPLLLLGTLFTLITSIFSPLGIVVGVLFLMTILAPCLVSFLAYFKKYYAFSILISMLTIIIIGAASAHMVMQYVATKKAPTGILVPTAASFPPEIAQPFMTQFAPTNYDVANYAPPGVAEYLDFENGTDSLFISTYYEYDYQNDLKETTPEQFTFRGVEGYLFVFPNASWGGGSGAEYDLYWNDRTQYIRILFRGPAGRFSAQDVIALLGTLQVQPPLQGPVAAYLNFGEKVCKSLWMDPCFDQ